jgi:hypothetical protein
VGVAAAELDLVGPGDPVQQPAGIVDAGVGAHEIEDRAGMVDEVVGEEPVRAEPTQRVTHLTYAVQER